MGISVGSRRGEGSSPGEAFAPRTGGAATPPPQTRKPAPGGRHSPPTRTATVVPRRPPAGKMCVLDGSLDGTGCDQAAGAIAAQAREVQRVRDGRTAVTPRVGLVR